MSSEEKTMVLKRERMNNSKLGYLSLYESQFCMNKAFSTSQFEFTSTFCCKDVLVPLSSRLNGLSRLKGAFILLKWRLLRA